MSQAGKTLGLFAGLLVVAGALGLYAYYGVYKHDEAETKKKEHEERLFAPQKLGERERDGGTVKTEWTKLTVMTPDGLTVLTRTPGQEWRIVSPVKARADKLVVDGVTSQLQTARFKATLEEKPDDATLSKYGLKPPKFSVEAEAEVGEEEKEHRSVRLEGGIENTFDGSVYMRRAGDEAVHMAEGGVRWSLAKSTFELRAKDVLGVDPDKTKSIAMKSAANDWLVEKQADKSWKIVRPISEVADLQQIAMLFSAIGKERAQSFPVDSPAARKELGLDAPMIDATFTLEGGKTVRVRMGKAAEGKLHVLRTEDDGETLAEVSATAPAALDHNVNLMRDRSIVQFKKELVTKAVFHGEGPEVVVEKSTADAGAEAWTVTAPKPGPAKVFKITSVLWTLGSLKSSAVTEERPKSWAKYGLDDKAKWIALFAADGKELARFTIGSAVPRTGQSYYVRGTRNQVAEADGTRFNEFPFKVEDVLDAPPQAARLPDAGK